VELASPGDDLGTQSSLLISPQIFHDFLLPEYKRLFELYKKNGVLINFHCCGHVEPLLDIFTEIGVDILNPVQATANNLRSVRERTRGKITLCGGISTHRLMLDSVDDIENMVKRTMALLGADGGYICTPDQHMPFEKDKLDALIQTVEEYGKYPINIQ
jgi:uroporphyrinogen decarboxylase